MSTTWCCTTGRSKAMVLNALVRLWSPFVVLWYSETLVKDCRRSRSIAFRHCPSLGGTKSFALTQQWSCAVTNVHVVSLSSTKRRDQAPKLYLSWLRNHSMDNVKLHAEAYCRHGWTEGRLFSGLMTTAGRPLHDGSSSGLKRLWVETVCRPLDRLSSRKQMDISNSSNASTIGLRLETNVMRECLQAVFPARRRFDQLGSSRQPQSVTSLFCLRDSLRLCPRDSRLT